jgi:hypothetical protein
MVEIEEVNDLFLKICPNIKDKWEEHLKWWEGDEEGYERGYYNDIAEFVHYSVDCYEQNDRATLAEIFSLVERLILDGSSDVKGLMIVGFLETLQSYASHRVYGYRVFEDYLGSQSREAWRQIEVLWEGKEALADVLRFEKEVERKGK